MTHEELGRMICQKYGTPELSREVAAQAVADARASDEHERWLKLVDSVCCEVRLLVRRRGLTAEQKTAAIKTELKRIV